MRKLVTIMALAALALPMQAHAKQTFDGGHTPPQKPAADRFAPDFRSFATSHLNLPLIDHEWDHNATAGFGYFPLGGFGGVSQGAVLHHVPVIFVHGNDVDAADWYPVRKDFEDAGWSDQELWGLSYNGLGAANGSALFTPNPERDSEHQDMQADGISRVTNDEGNVEDLHDFILAVRAYTGSDKFSIVGHSLGVTLARETLQVYPGLRDDLVAFVGIAGANHGTTFCPPGSEDTVFSCDEIAAGTPWLDRLNGGPNGTDETYSPARWLTIYDGTGVGDPAYVGPTYAKSPRLTGAKNCEFPNTYHNDLRLDPTIVAIYRAFLEGGDAPCPLVAA